MMMEPVLNVSKIMKLINMETVFQSQEDHAMNIVLFINTLILKDLATKNGSKDVKEYVKSVMKDTTLLKIISVLNFLQIVLKLIRMENVLNAKKITKSMKMVNVLKFQKIIALFINTLMWKEILTLNGSKDVRKYVNIVMLVTVWIMMVLVF